MKIINLALFSSAFGDLLAINRTMNKLNFGHHSYRNDIIYPQEEKVLNSIFSFNSDIKRQYESFVLRQHTARSFKIQRKMNFIKYHQQN